MKQIICVTIAALSVNATMAANTYDGAGLTGLNNSIRSSSLVVPDNFSVQDVNVSMLSLNHTFSGSLIITIAHAGQTATLVHKIGSTDGIGPGSGANYGGDYTFDSESVVSIWSAAAGLGTNDTIPVGTYDTSAPLTGAGTSALDVFQGLSSAGTWTLTINATLTDVGSLGGWRLHLVPEPASLTLLGLAALALRRRA